MGEESQTQFRAEGQPAFPAESKENENSSSSSEGEKTNADSNQSQGGAENSGAKKPDGEADNFLNHPRWKEREEDWKNRYNEQEKRHADEMAAFRSDIEKRLGAKSEGSEDEVPDWFGGDAKQFASYKAERARELKEAEERAFKRIQSSQSEEQKKIDEATKFFQDEVVAMEADKELNPQGLKIDRNKLLKTALDNDLIDSKGRWNYRVAFRLMKPSEVFAAKAALDERKKIANATTENNRAESGQPKFTTSKDFSKPENRPW